MILWLFVVAFAVVGVTLIVLLWLLMTADRVHEVAGVRTRPVACPECGWGEAHGLRVEPSDALTYIQYAFPPTATAGVRRTTTVCWGCAEPLTAENVLDRP